MLASACDPVVLVVPSPHLDRVTGELDGGERIQVVAGGPTRQESVGKGLAAVEREQVVVHDAARPLATREMVAAVLNGLQGNDAAVTGIPVGDTVKRIDEGRVIETVAREKLWISQTPQAFTTGMLKEAHEWARGAGYVSSDDAELIEKRGGTVAVVQGSTSNLKITWPSDLAVAEAVSLAG